MNIHVSAKVSAQHFKAGDFVRIQNGETVGRVIEDTYADGSTIVNVFDDDSFGDNPKFGPGILSMWTPVPTVPVTSLPNVRPAVDTGRITKLILKILGGSDTLGNLARLEMSNNLRDSGDVLPLNIEFIHNAIDEAAGELLDIIETEERRQEAS